MFFPGNKRPGGVFFPEVGVLVVFFPGNKRPGSIFFPGNGRPSCFLSGK